MKKLLLLILMVFLCQNCSRVRYYNAAPESDRITMKRAELLFLNGDVVKLDDITVDTAKGILFSAETDLGAFKHSLSELQSLKYSNSNLGTAGFLTGFVTGITIAWNNMGSGTSHIGEMTVGTPKGLIAGIAGGAVGGIGYLIGKRFHRNWKEFDLTQYKKQ